MVFDLAQLQPLTSQLDLVVLAANVVERPVLLILNEIPCLVHPAAHSTVLGPSPARVCNKGSIRLL
ncbi:hypothetical protein BJY01DRAFT_209500 [Aspergillus pseudoustus]|uniref:Uncharacterized protein n=1 Tax=Aspergillus pseudoustus TaxID=1810923 RepID=A0ABR4KG44_9EURO